MPKLPAELEFRGNPIGTAWLEYYLPDFYMHIIKFLIKDLAELH